METSTLKMWLKKAVFWLACAGSLHVAARLVYWTQFRAWRVDTSPLYYLWDEFNELGLTTLYFVHFFTLALVVGFAFFLAKMYEFSFWAYPEVDEDEEGEIEEGDEVDEERPVCKDPFCRCISHGAEVFKDGEWVTVECDDPQCHCPDYHPDREITEQTFMTRPQQTGR